MLGFDVASGDSTGLLDLSCHWLTRNTSLILAILLLVVAVSGSGVDGFEKGPPHA